MIKASEILKIKEDADAGSVSDLGQSPLVSVAYKKDKKKKKKTQSYNF